MWLFKSFAQGVYTLCSGTHLGDHFSIHSASPVSEQGCSSFSKYGIAFSALDLGSLLSTQGISFATNQSSCSSNSSQKIYSYIISPSGPYSGTKISFLWTPSCVMTVGFICVHRLLDSNHLRDELMPVTLPKTYTHFAHSRCSLKEMGRPWWKNESMILYIHPIVFFTPQEARFTSQRDVWIFSSSCSSKICV